MQLQLYFRFTPIREVNKVLFAITFMRGKALRWVKLSVKKYEDSNNDNRDLAQITTQIESFIRFKVELRRTIGPLNESNVTIKIVQHLAQKKSIANYATQFQQYTTETGQDNAALITIFRRGLKDYVKDKLTRSGAVLETLSELIKELININNKWYERSIEKKYN